MIFALFFETRILLWISYFPPSLSHILFCSRRCVDQKQNLTFRFESNHSEPDLGAAVHPDLMNQLRDYPESNDDGERSKTMFLYFFIHFIGKQRFDTVLFFFLSLFRRQLRLLRRADVAGRWSDASISFLQFSETFVVFFPQVLYSFFSFIVHLPLLFLLRLLTSWFGFFTFTSFVDVLVQSISFRFDLHLLFCYFSLWSLRIALSPTFTDAPTQWQLVSVPSFPLSCMCYQPYCMLSAVSSYTGKWRLLMRKETLVDQGKSKENNPKFLMY